MSKSDAVIVMARRIDPARNAYEDLALSVEAQATLDAIVQAPVATRAPSARPLIRPDRARMRRRVALQISAVAAVAIVVVTVTTMLAPSDPPGRGRDMRVWSAELLSVADGSPRLLLDPEEWKVTRADEVSGEMGEMIFQNGRDCDLLPLKEGCYAVTLHWRPANTHEQYFRDRKRGSDASSEVTIDGNKAAVFAHHGMAFGTTFYAMWLDGPHSLELRSDVIPTLDEFNAIAVGLHEVDAEAWLAVMPPGAVTPAERGDDRRAPWRHSPSRQRRPGRAPEQRPRQRREHLAIRSRAGRRVRLGPAVGRRPGSARLGRRARGRRSDERSARLAPDEGPDMGPLQCDRRRRRHGGQRKARRQ